MTKLVYLAGPITGLTYEDARFGWRQEFKNLLHPHLNVLSPMRHELHLAEQGTIEDVDYPDNPLNTSRGIVTKDRMDIRRASVFVACLLGAKSVSVGTLIECGWANAYGLPIVVVVEDEGNCHDRLFLREIADYRVNGVVDATSIVNGLLSEGV